MRIETLSVPYWQVPGAVRRFGKKKVYIGGLLIWVLGDLLNYFFGGGSVSFVTFSCLAFFGSAFATVNTSVFAFYATA